MYNKDEAHSVFITIVEKGKASKILEESKKVGVKGGTIVYGKGTASGGLLHLLELYEIKKEILVMVLENRIIEDLIVHLNEKFHFEKTNHGIAFSIPLTNVMGYTNKNSENYITDRSGKMNYDAVFVIVERGNADEVIEVADKSGARGATVIHGRGSGVHEKGSIFNIVIEPEKEIVLMLVQSDKTESIISSIKEELDIDKPGKGIIFVTNVDKAVGLV